MKNPIDKRSNRLYSMPKGDENMLLTCPECDLPVSSKAMTCPHCGYPLAAQPRGRKRTTINKRRRLPNGFGQITEIKGANLRKPFRASVTVGKDDEGRCIKKLLKPEAYFETYNDAYTALLEYNKNPYDLDVAITVKQLYDEWSTEYFATITESAQRTVRAAWDFCSELYSMRVKDIRPRHIKGVMQNGTKLYRGEQHSTTPYSQGRIKSLFNLMLDYAMEHEIVVVNYARTFDITDDVIKEQDRMKRAHIPYTSEEMQILWDHADSIEWVDVMLIQCYSGWRPQEIGLIELDRVDIANWFFQGGMKTDAGIDRVVPIHTKIRPLVKRHYDKAVSLGSKYLFNCTDTKTHRSSYMLTYDKYQQRYNKVRDFLHLNPEHRAHDGRKHFITMAKDAKVDEYAIKYMAGHQIADITEKVYTVRKPEWLQSEIEKIK